MAVLTLQLGQTKNGKRYWHEYQAPVLDAGKDEELQEFMAKRKESEPDRNY